MALCRSTSAPTGRQGHRATGAGRSFTTTLALLCTVQFMLVLDVAVAAVALVPIQREFDVSAGNLQWVTTAYGVTFGGLLVLGGRLARARRPADAAGGPDHIHGRLGRLRSRPGALATVHRPRKPRESGQRSAPPRH